MKRSFLFAPRVTDSTGQFLEDRLIHQYARLEIFERKILVG